MHYGLYLPIFDELADPTAVAKLASDAEDNGWDGFFVWDHQYYRAPVIDIADPWITLAAVAAATERIRLGPMVTPLPRRRPVKVARETVTLDRLSGGRLILGVGTADDGDGELSATGEETDAKVRAQMLDESLTILQDAWTGEPVHHHGAHYTVHGLSVRPRPVQRPGVPIWVAALQGFQRPLVRAARYDGIFPVRIERPEQLAEIVATVTGLREQADASGPFDVAVGGRPGVDPAPYEKVGATWWMVTFPWDAPSIDQVRAVIMDGPPVTKPDLRIV